MRDDFYGEFMGDYSDPLQTSFYSDTPEQLVDNVSSFDLGSLLAQSGLLPTDSYGMPNLSSLYQDQGSYTIDPISGSFSSLVDSPSSLQSLINSSQVSGQGLDPSTLNALNSGAIMQLGGGFMDPTTGQFITSSELPFVDYGRNTVPPDHNWTNQLMGISNTRNPDDYNESTGYPFAYREARPDQAWMDQLPGISNTDVMSYLNGIPDTSMGGPNSPYDSQGGSSRINLSIPAKQASQGLQTLLRGSRNGVSDADAAQGGLSAVAGVLAALRALQGPQDPPPGKGDNRGATGMRWHRFAKGGGITDNPRTNTTIPGSASGALGLLRGAESGQSDRVPVAASPGEYVMDADTVSALGDGNNEAGASVLDQMRKNIRAHKRSAPPSKIPPKAKKPEQYLKGAK